MTQHLGPVCANRISMQQSSIKHTSKQGNGCMKDGGFEWAQDGRDHWVGSVPHGQLPPRIKRLDEHTHACYRDGIYLGSEPTMEDAFARIKANKRSAKNETNWADLNPDLLPPGLQLTAWERAEYWRTHPPVNAAQAARPMTGGKRDGVPKSVGVKQMPEAVVVKPVRAVKVQKVQPGSRDAEIVDLLKRGCTSEEVLRVTGWKAISMPAMAKRLGLALRIDKGTKPFKYYGSSKQ